MTRGIKSSIVTKFHTCFDMHWLSTQPPEMAFSFLSSFHLGPSEPQTKCIYKSEQQTQRCSPSGRPNWRERLQQSSLAKRIQMLENATANSVLGVLTLRSVRMKRNNKRWRRHKWLYRGRQGERQTWARRQTRIRYQEPASVLRMPETLKPCRHT